MYDNGRALGATVPPTAAVTTLPVTGSSETLVQIAIAVAAGLVAWGALYVYQARRSNI